MKRSKFELEDLKALIFVLSSARHATKGVKLLANNGTVLGGKDGGFGGSNRKGDFG